MTTQQEQAEAFAALHVKGRPLVLHNIWDAGSARAVAEAGAPAIATGSWAVAAAQGFADGEALPMADVLRCAEQIVGAVDVPVSVDFETGYATEPGRLARNVAALMHTGAVGMNLEDRVIGGKGLVTAGVQAARINAIRAMADAAGVAFFINARTDVFFGGSDADDAGKMTEVLARAAVYAEAGASGLFVPGLKDPDLIKRLCAATDLPVNVMRSMDGASVAALSDRGVARISHGPAHYLKAMQELTRSVKGEA